MSIKRQYLKKDGVCKITFSLKDDNEMIKTIRLLGEFNDWDRKCVPMKKVKNNGFSQAINLKSGKSYQFRYLVNDSVWEDEPECDNYVPNGVGEFNSLIQL